MFVLLEDVFYFYVAIYIGIQKMQRGLHTYFSSFNYVFHKFYFEMLITICSETWTIFYIAVKMLSKGSSTFDKNVCSPMFSLTYATISFQECQPTLCSSYFNLDS